MFPSRLSVCALAILALGPAFATAQALPTPPQVQPPISKPQSPEEVRRALEQKQKEMAELKMRATEVTKSLGELAASGKVPTSQEALATMRAMVEVLQEIQDRLERIEADIASMKDSLKSHQETIPKISSDLMNLKRSRWSNYIQVQYRDTDQVGGAPDAFSVRRVRIGIVQNVDPRTLMRMSFDLATGTTQTAGQLRDAFVKWDVQPPTDQLGTEILAGQFQLPLGYEIERSSSEREFPERSLYNRTMFAGERSRGVLIRHGLNPNMVFELGGYNALTVDDPEQRNVAPGPASRLAMSGGLRYADDQFDLGLGVFMGERPSVTTTRTVNNVTTTFVHPNVDREFIFLDGTWLGFLVPEAYLRFEIMKGRDRVPVTPGANNSVTAVQDGVNMLGYQLQVGYQLNPRNQVHARFEAFDPDEDVDGNQASLWGLAYSYFINPKARLTLSREWVEDPARVSLNDVNYQITTLRVVFRF